ncbi:YkgJ family cysteine cluster protein [Desulfosarcina ovata]|uniref:Zinc/iron-chelating domain-containing protein n=2 Tax=Desulfosarcina ovata TaxID=83564 RepID=A0A5K8AAA5_9BACT|nr:YkgJ family cysteine cluster protein [Desulfosarcina ovata]BBO82223.1 zinc/iron-chelating domain-containing protein [Desulfosarcina ovata subsp. sediminis]BBO89436.1 zinc/iron-chelating domain-containing protein [Desulfosarcina ovata subsp. ovata]
MTCRRCGTCCEKGGPSLHHADFSLVADGLIPARCLFTIRQGERVRDNVRDRLIPLNHEIVKIKGRDGKWTCCFYDRDRRGCGIYAHRPLECRVLDCRDTRQIEAIYEIDRLTRKELLEPAPAVWELVTAHEQRCSYALLGRLIGLGCTDGRYREESAIFEMLRYDAHLRELVVGNGGMDASMLDFIFGRPLSTTIHMFGVRLVRGDGDYRLVESTATAGTRPSFST